MLHKFLHPTLRTSRWASLRAWHGWGWFGIICYSFVALLALSWAADGWGYDDPFITYRYAENLSHGLGFVYNPGERILSTTTPLFTLVLAIFGHIFPDLPRLAVWFGAVSLVAGSLFLWDLARSWETPLVGWVCLLLYPSFPLLATTLGSETPLYIAWILGSFACYARQRYFCAAILSGLAVLTRPDGLVVPFLLAVHFLSQKKRSIPWAAVLVFLFVVLSWFVFAWLYFGSPLPVTLSTKQQQGSMEISQRFAEGLLTTFRPYSLRWTYLIEAGFALVGLGFAGWRARRWLLLLAWAVLYFAAYALLGVSRYFWYYAPLVPALLALVGLGVAALVGLGRRAFSWLSQPALATLLALSLILPSFVSQALGVQRSLSQTARLEIYRAVGEWLDANLPAQASVGTLEVGIIGYYARRPMVDFAGLLQPDTAQQINPHSVYDDIAVYAAFNHQPDYLVLQEGLFPKLEASYVAQYCRLVRAFSGEEYRYPHNLEVYSCH